MKITLKIGTVRCRAGVAGHARERWSDPSRIKSTNRVIGCRGGTDLLAAIRTVDKQIEPVRQKIFEEPPGAEIRRICRSELQNRVRKAGAETRYRATGRI